MDVAAAALGIVNATLRASSKIWTLCDSWKDSPREVYLLRDALDHAQEFFEQVRQGIVEKSRTERMGGPSGNPRYEESLSKIESLLRQGCAIVIEIEMIVEGIMEGWDPDLEATVASPASLSKRRRIAWLAKATTVARLRAVLNETCFIVSANLITLNLTLSMELLPNSSQSVISRIQATESSLAENINQLAERTESSLAENINRSAERTLSTIEQRLDTLTAHITSRIDDGHSAVGRHGPLRGGSPRQSASVLTPVDTLFLSSATVEASLATLRSERNEGLSRCKEFCSCSCHRWSGSLVRSWEWRQFKKTLGSATLDYSGYLTRRASCDNRGCQRHNTGEIVRFNYQFPAWLLRVAVCLCFSTRVMGVPELLVRVYRILPIEELPESIIGIVFRRDLRGLKCLLQDRRGSIYDVDPTHGRTPLYYAIEKEDMAMVRLLLQVGADPFYEDSYQCTPMHLSLQILEKKSSWGNQLAQVLPLQEILHDEDKYTSLHRIILGILPHDLQEQINNPENKALLETHSWNGRTPLHLAALRGDVKSTQLLVSAGADVSSRNSISGRLLLGVDTAHRGVSTAHGDSPPRL